MLKKKFIAPIFSHSSIVYNKVQEIKEHLKHLPVTSSRNCFSERVYFEYRRETKILGFDDDDCRSGVFMVVIIVRGCFQRKVGGYAVNKDRWRRTSYGFSLNDCIKSC